MQCSSDQLDPQAAVALCHIGQIQYESNCSPRRYRVLVPDLYKGKLGVSVEEVREVASVGTRC